VNVSPASAAIACREPYVSGAWNIDICVHTNTIVFPPGGGQYREVTGLARVYNRPSNCATVRIYLVDQNNVQRFSTSARPCGETFPASVHVWNGEFRGLDVKARFVAYAGNGGQILSRESPFISSL
jgi:hypothetical protein